MALRFWFVPTTLVYWSAAALWAQQPAPIVQPGAPGESGKILSTVPPSTRVAADADITFMQGMIMHHSQAVEMTALMPRAPQQGSAGFGKRISISQTDEIKFMKQWLEDRGKPIRDGARHERYGPDGCRHGSHENGYAMLMPGMLTPAADEGAGESHRRGLRPSVSDWYDSTSHRRSDYGGGSVRHSREPARITCCSTSPPMSIIPSARKSKSCRAC